MTAVFNIPGTPVAKARPRAVMRGGHARMYTPAKTANFEALVAEAAREHFEAPHETPVRVTIHCTFPVPKSCSKAERARRMNRPHIQKPDGDNLVKAVLDALNGVAFHDDKQACDIRVTKQWGEVGKTLVIVEAPMSWGAPPI